MKELLLPNLTLPRKIPTLRNFEKEKKNMKHYMKLFIISFSNINEEKI